MLFLPYLSSYDDLEAMRYYADILMTSRIRLSGGSSLGPADQV